jgi:hypothetical protein
MDEQEFRAKCEQLLDDRLNRDIMFTPVNGKEGSVEFNVNWVRSESHKSGQEWSSEAAMLRYLNLKAELETDGQ